MRGRKTRAGPGVAAALLLALAATPGRTLSMRHSAAEARLAEAGPVPLTIANTGPEAAEVALALEAASPGALKDGFEPMPGAAWIRLERRALSLGPGAEAPVPARLSVPPDPGDLGQYQAELVTESRSASGERLRLTSSLLVVAPDEGDEEVERARKKARPSEEAVLALARREARFDVPLGRRFRLAGALQAANVGTRDAHAAATVRAPKEPDKGQEAAPNARFLKLKRRTARVAPGRVEELALEFYAPDEPRYRGRVWRFDVELETLEAPHRRPDTLRVVVVTPGQEKPTR